MPLKKVWWAKSSVKNIEIGDVEMDGTLAKGYMISYGEQSPLFSEFNKEATKWKLDLTSIFPMSFLRL
jgi:hypothetical protein